MKKYQEGFSLVEGLLIVIIVGMLGGVGYYVWHSQNQVDKTYSQTANSNVVPNTSKVKQSVKPTVPSDFLIINEWGVKFTYSSEIGKAVYRTDSMDPDFVFLSTEALQNTDCDVTHNGGGYIVRFQDGQMDGEAKKAYKDEYPDAVKSGAYYYAYGLPEYAEKCSKVSSVQQKATEAANELKSAVKSVQPIT
jgi:hypothetical protein